MTHAQSFFSSVHYNLYRTFFGVSLGVGTCELFLSFAAIVRVRAFVLTSLFSLFYVTGEFTGSYTEVEPFWGV